MVLSRRTGATLMNLKDSVAIYRQAVLVFQHCHATETYKSTVPQLRERGDSLLTVNHLPKARPPDRTIVPQTRGLWPTELKDEDISQALLLRSPGRHSVRPEQLYRLVLVSSA